MRTLDALSPDGVVGLQMVVFAEHGLPKGTTAAAFLARVRGLSLEDAATMTDLVQQLEGQSDAVQRGARGFDQIEMLMTYADWPEERAQAAMDECMRAKLIGKS